MGKKEFDDIKQAISLTRQGRKLNLSSGCAGTVFKALGGDIDLNDLIAIEGIGINLKSWSKKLGFMLQGSNMIQLNNAMETDTLRDY